MTQGIRTQCYLEGMRRALKFCKVNSIPYPVFTTYDELMAAPDAGPANRFASRVMRCAPLVGANTGLYRAGTIFVNIKVTAIPVVQPGMRNWSWPCYKTDRTAVGVVAHELGHHVQEIMTASGAATPAHGAQWRAIIQRYRKQVSGYEPVPSEAMAETMRLFILNPNLLRQAIPQRYEFLTKELKLRPSEKRGWRDVLSAAHGDYFAAAERWIGARR